MNTTRGGSLTLCGHLGSCQRQKLSLIELLEPADREQQIQRAGPQLNSPLSGQQAKPRLGQRLQLNCLDSSTDERKGKG